jgi:hypothetical protein
MRLFLLLGHWYITIQRTLILKETLHTVQRTYRNINLQMFTKWTNCGGNCIAGNVVGADGCEEWRCRYWEGLVRRSMVQTWQSPSVIYCGIFHLQNTFQCTCTRYNVVLFAMFVTLLFWVSYFVNQNNATTFGVIRKRLLFCKTFKLAPAQATHWSTCQLLSQCCLLISPIPHTDPVLILFCLCPFTYMTEPVTVVDCYEMWQFCSLLNAIQRYKLNT